MSLLHLDFTPDREQLTSSLANAFEAIYLFPKIRENKVKRLIGVIRDIVKVLRNDQTDTFHRFSSKVVPTLFNEVKHIKGVTKCFKILAFNNKDDIFTFYLHLRGAKYKKQSDGKYKTYHKIVRLDANKNGISLAKIYGQLVTKISKQSESYHHCVEMFDNEVSHLKKLKGTHGVVDLFHSVIYEKSGDHDKVKMRMFEEDFDIDLHDHINKLYADPSTRISEYLKVETFFFCLSALKQFHKRKLIHGDVKPVNILLKHSNPTKLVLCDLAFTKRLKHRGDHINLEGLTPEFLPYDILMEVITTSSLATLSFGLHSDVWALGATLHMLLTGDIPACSILFPQMIELVFLLNDLETQRKLLIDSSEDNGGSKSSEESTLSIGLSLGSSTSISIPLISDENSLNTEERQWESDDDLALKNHRSKASTSSSSHKHIIKMNRLFNELTQLRSDLKELDLQVIGNAFDVGQLNQVQQFAEELGDVIDNINKQFLSEKMLTQLSKPKNIARTLTDFDRLQTSLNGLKSELVASLKNGVEFFSIPSTSDDFLIGLIRQMMHPNPKERISIDTALKRVRKDYPVICKALQESLNAGK